MKRFFKITRTWLIEADSMTQALEKARKGRQIDTQVLVISEKKFMELQSKI